MRFVAAYYLAQKPLKDRRAPGGSAAPRRLRGVLVPVTRWLVALRPSHGAVRSSQPAQTARASRNAS